MKKITSSMLLAGIVVCGPSFADNFELNLSAPFYSFDEKNQSTLSPVDDVFGGAISGAYRFDNPFGVELVLSQAQTEFTASGADFDLMDARVDGLFHFLEGQKASPYLVAGLGYWDMNFSDAAHSDETSANIGAGVKYMFAEQFGLRFDTRYLHTLDFDSGHTVATLGLNYVFGKTSSKKSNKPPMLLKNEKPLDGDFDGIADAQDNCLNTPKSVKVDAMGCAIDSDNDAVADYQDKCPNSDKNIVVDASGCAVIETQPVVINLDIEFDTNSAKVKPEFFPQIEQVKTFLKSYPEAKVAIEGHSDNTGRAAYNLELSAKRAEAIAQILIEKFGVDASRVESKGYGDSRPIASNESAVGRAKNRRVQAQISAMKSVPKLRTQISNIPAEDFE